MIKVNASAVVMVNDNSPAIETVTVEASRLLLAVAVLTGCLGVKSYCLRFDRVTENMLSNLVTIVIIKKR